MSSSTTPVSLQTQQWNPQGDRSVLLVHGLSASSGTWWRVASALASSGLRVVAPDLRGHGMSPRTASYSFDEHCEDLDLLGGSWDLAIGHSLAGPILARLAKRGGLSRLLLLDPVLQIADDDFDAVVEDQLSELDPEVTVDGMSAANPRWHIQDCFQKLADARAMSSHVVERCLRDNAPYRHLALLESLDVPTLVLGADPSIGTMCDREQVTGVGNQRIEHRIVEGAGHGIQREQPDRVVEAALELLQLTA
ncbi:MAG: alpha/beta fold hydrolase [Acidimicrobiales bacterium]